MLRGEVVVDDDGDSCSESDRPPARAAVTHSGSGKNKAARRAVGTGGKRAWLPSKMVQKRPRRQPELGEDDSWLPRPAAPASKRQRAAAWGSKRGLTGVLATKKERELPKWLSAQSESRWAPDGPDDWPPDHGDHEWPSEREDWPLWTTSRKGAPRAPPFSGGKAKLLRKQQLGAAPRVLGMKLTKKKASKGVAKKGKKNAGKKKGGTKGKGKR